MAVFPRLEDYEWVAPDTETTGLQWYKGDRPFGIAIALPNGYSEYYDIRADIKAYQWAKEQFPRIRRAVNHNIKFDWHMLSKIGIHIPLEVCECTGIRAALIDEHLPSYSLDYLAKRYLGREKVDDIYAELAAMFGGPSTRKAQIVNLHRAPPSLVRRYARVDSELAGELWLWQEKEIERQDLHQVWALEKRLFPHICRTEANGIRVDQEYAEQSVDRLNEVVRHNQKSLAEMAGISNVEVNSSKCMEMIFKPYSDGHDDQGNKIWKTRTGELIKTTKGGKPSFAKDSIEGLKHPIAKMIVNTRKIIKARDTFVLGHVLGHQVGGRVYPNINQTKSDDEGGIVGTGTGRLSYTEPAMQQIPSRDKQTAEIVRPIFLPEEGQKWSYGDLDQHEFRIFAHYAKPEALLRAYAENPDLDMHQIVADMTGLPRSAKESGGANAKQINLAMVFNMGGGELADRMGLPYEWASSRFEGEDEDRWYKLAGYEAKEVMERYYAAVPGVREVARQASSLAKSRHYVKTMYGRRIHFPGGKFAYKASGLVYQGTAADFNKENICLVAEYLASECPHNRFLLNIHDEYSMSLQDEGDITIRHLKEIKALIENKGLRVPIRIDFGGLAPNWWEATKMDLVTK